MKNVQMRNGNILTLPTETETTRESGLIVQVDLRNYRILEVVVPDEQDNVKVGDKLYVPLHSGTEVEGHIVVNLRDIILIK